MPTLYKIYPVRKPLAALRVQLGGQPADRGHDLPRLRNRQELLDLTPAPDHGDAFARPGRRIEYGLCVARDVLTKYLLAQPHQLTRSRTHHRFVLHDPQLP